MMEWATRGENGPSNLIWPTQAYCPFVSISTPYRHSPTLALIYNPINILCCLLPLIKFPSREKSDLQKIITVVPIFE